MRQGGGKAKGSSFERKVCAALSLWVSKGEHKDLYWRSAMSGGRATVTRKRGGTNRQAGDICSVTEEGHSLTDKYYIECKHVKDLQFDQFCLRAKGCLTQFWRVAQQQAKDHNRSPMVIAQQNRYPALVLTEMSVELQSYPTLIIPHLECELRLFDDLLTAEYEVRRGKN